MNHEEAAILALHSGIWRNRYLLGEVCTELPDDQGQDVFLLTWTAILEGGLEHPRALWGFVRTVRYRVHCQAIIELHRAVFEDFEIVSRMAATNDMAPDERQVARERGEGLSRAMLGLPESDRRILRGFYLDDCSREGLMEEMQLTGTQYRLKKSRAIEKLRKMMLGASKRFRRAIYR